jgi:hypothetical protein
MSLELGTAVRVYWTQEKRWFNGVVGKSRTDEVAGRRREVHHVTYSDGDKKWHVLTGGDAQAEAWERRETSRSRSPAKSPRAKASPKRAKASPKRTKSPAASPAGLSQPAVVASPEVAPALERQQSPASPRAHPMPAKGWTWNVRSTMAEPSAKMLLGLAAATAAYGAVNDSCNLTYAGLAGMCYYGACLGWFTAHR